MEAVIVVEPTRAGSIGLLQEYGVDAFLLEHRPCRQSGRSRADNRRFVPFHCASLSIWLLPSASDCRIPASRRLSRRPVRYGASPTGPASITSGTSTT